MFRKLTRVKQQLSAEECAALLKREKRGVLSVLGDGGYPYGMPHNHWYCEEDGKLYFHSGQHGHKIDALRRCGKASYCVCDGGVQNAGEWFLTFRSVIVFGQIEFTDEPEQIARISRQLSYQFTSDEQYIDDEIRRCGAATLCFALKPEHICGKLVREC